VLIPDNAYGPNKALALRRRAEKPGASRTSCYDPMDPQDLRRASRPRTKLVWLEAAGSVTMEFPDLAHALVHLAVQAGRGWRWTTPGGQGIGAFCSPFDLMP
jgi:cystathionine beta-lyase